MTIIRMFARRLALLATMAALLFATAAHAQTVVYYHTDALGSPVATTDAAGNVLERTEYEPYGQVLNHSVADGPSYTGHVTDAQTGLSYMQQRYYDPIVGRFLSTDPISTDANSGNNFNRYWYANNNPYRFIDPDGRGSCDDYHKTCDVQTDNGNFFVGIFKAFRDGFAPVAHALVDPYGTNISTDYDHKGPGPGLVEQGGYKFGNAYMIAEFIRAPKTIGGASAGFRTELSFGRKLDFMFDSGIDQSNAYNAARAQGNARRMGIADTPANRAEVQRRFNDAYRNPSTILGPGKTPGSTKREFFLPGVTGTGRMVEFVEKDGQVITIIVK